MTALAHMVPSDELPYNLWALLRAKASGSLTVVVVVIIIVMRISIQGSLPHDPVSSPNTIRAHDVLAYAPQTGVNTIRAIPTLALHAVGVFVCSTS